MIAVVAGGCTAEPQPARSAPDTTNTPASSDVIATSVAQPTVVRDSLLGPWGDETGNFVWVIEPDSILFEQDMQRYPYRLAGDTLLIDRTAAGIGIQKTRILRLTGDTMVISDAAIEDTSETLLRLR